MTANRPAKHTMNITSIVQKIWNFCHTLRDDCGSYGVYQDQQRQWCHSQCPIDSEASA